MPARILTPPPSLDQSKYLAIVYPYPLNANLDLHVDQCAMALWLACCAGKEVLRTIFYKPSFPEMVVIEVNPDLERFRELLGQHVWSEFLLQPTKEQRGKSSTVFYSTFHTSRLVNNGWKCVKIEEHLFQEWADNDPYRNPFIKYPYPKSSQCNSTPSSKAKSGEPVCSLLPQSFSMPLPAPAPRVPSAEWLAAIKSNAGSTPSKTAAPSSTVSLPSASSKGTTSSSASALQSPPPSSAVSNHLTKNDSRKREPPAISSKLSAGTPRVPSTVGSSNARSQIRALPAPPSLGPTFTSQSRTTGRFADWGGHVEQFESQQMSRPLPRKPVPNHSTPAPRQVYDPLGPIEPSRVYDYDEEDQPRDSTAAAMTDLFDEDFFEEAPLISISNSGTRAPSPDDHGHYPLDSPSGVGLLDPDDPDFDPWKPTGGDRPLGPDDQGHDSSNSPSVVMPLSTDKQDHDPSNSPSVVMPLGSDDQDHDSPNSPSVVIPLGPDHPDYDPWNSGENLWEGYDTPRLELPTKVKKNGEWTCSHHGSLCSPGICKERARFERDERMRDEREKWEEERIQRETRRSRDQRKREKKGVVTALQPLPPHLHGSSSSCSNGGSNSSDTSRDEGSSVSPHIDEEDRSTDGYSAGGADTQSTVSSASRAEDLVARLNDDDYDEGMSVASSRTTNTNTNTSSAVSRNSHSIPPPASVSSRRQNKGPTTEGAEVDSASRAEDWVARLNDDEFDEGEIVVRVPTTNTNTNTKTDTSSAVSRDSRITAPPASVSSRRQNKGPTSPATLTPLGNLPTSPGPTTRQPTLDARSVASQSPSAGSRKLQLLPKLSGNSRPASISASTAAAPDQRSVTGTATRKSASTEARNSVSSKARTRASPSTVSTSSTRANESYLGNPIGTWLANAAAAQAQEGNRKIGGRAVNGEAKISKGARKRRNKAKAAQEQASAEEQAAQASALEAEIEVELPAGGPGSSWGDPDAAW